MTARDDLRRVAELTKAERKSLQFCSCGHLIESHDFTGCFAHSEDFTPCSCEETFEGKLFTTTYSVIESVIESVIAARLDAKDAQLAAVRAALVEGPDTWTPYASSDTGETFLADSVLHFVADLRAALGEAQ